MFPKIFKGLLCDLFSLLNGQERPDVPVPGINLFPRRYRDKVERNLMSEKARVVILWDLMQSKALAAEVDQTFVKEALLKHRATVTKITTTSKETLERFQEFIAPWVQSVASEQLNGEFPNSHSCYEAARGKGGVRSQFLVTSTDFIQPTTPRLEPTTLLVSGKAGLGKSLFQTLLSSRLSRALNHSDTTLTTYCRNSMTEHWDGYCNQPVVMIDDFLQKVVRQAEDSSEHSEFITLNSSVDYVLPMADLKDKGCKFNSPLLILSSNKSVSQCIQTLEKTLSDRLAIARRFQYNLTYIVGKGVWRLQELQHRCTSEISSEVQTIARTIHECSHVADMVEPAASLLLGEWNRKGVFYRNRIDQTPALPVGSGQVLTCKADDDHNRVKVLPILEPLKVRTITVGTARNFFLKTVQKSMLNALRPYQAFKPCFTPDYDDEITQLHAIPGKIWLSGDYSSATDGLHSDLFRTGITSLVQALRAAGKPDWFCELMTREASEHVCEYPSSMGIPDCLQTNGQLMGSLLSFPLLCLANAFTVAQAEGHNRLSALDNALIHGDDLLWRTDLDSIERWKAFCPTIGLGLSMGKNYVSERWGSIDSQVFFEGKRMNTGKYTCYRGDHESKVTVLLKKGLSKAHVVTLSKAFLQKTPRSIDVSTEFGGLGVSGEPISNRARILYNLKARKEVGRIAKAANGYLVTLPAPFLPKSFDKSIDLEAVVSGKEEVQWRTLHTLEKKYKSVPPLDLPKLPKSRTVFVAERPRNLELLLENLKEHYCPLSSDSESM